MDPDSLAPTGALGTALIPIAASGGSIEPGRSVPQNPAEVLAALMDFPGSVALADLLDAAPSKVPPHRDAMTLAERLLDDVQARLDGLEPMAIKPLVGRRAPEVPEPHELMRALDRYGIRADRSEANIKRLAEYLGAPLGAALGASLRQAQAHVATLRWEIAHDLRALGPKADRLERLDAGLSRAMQVKMGELLDRMEYAAQLTFERACVHAVEALPEDFTEDDLTSWSEEDGWIGRYRERCVRMSKALFGHLRRSLEGLLRAAGHAEDT